MKRYIGMLMVIALMIGISTMSVVAGPILDFGIVAPTTGSISYAGGANPLVGAGISVDTVVGLGTPLNSGVSLTITNGVLDFTTGSFTGSTSTTWNFGGGGSLTLIGGISVIGIPNGTTLMSDDFNTASVTKSTNDFKVTIGGFSDTKNIDLLNYYGLPDKLYTGNMNISFEAAANPPNAFASTQVLSGDVTNSPPIPEPGTLLLLGSGLVGLVGYGKLRLQGRKKQ